MERGRSETQDRDGTGPERHQTAPKLTGRRTVAILVAAVVPLAVLFLLFMLDTPLGQPHLKYRFSPIPELRLPSAMVAILIGLGSLLALWAGMARGGRVGRRMVWFSGAGYAAIVLWTCFGPPDYASQHIFNLLSPSHEGAFVLEGRDVTSIRAYVSQDFYDRLSHEPEQLRGRRVLSNPPGVTVTFVLVRRMLERWTGLRGWLLDTYDLHELDDPDQATVFASVLVLAMLLTLVWGCSLVFAYKLCRLWMPPLAALAVALACVFNPSTVNFTPGKDPAQVTLVMALLMCWMTAYSRRDRWWGLAAGVVLAVALLFGLVFVWVLAIVAAATLWHALGTGGRVRGWVMHCAVPGVCGAMGIVVLLYVALGWNIPLMTYRIGVRYGQIQEGVITDPFYWMLLGLPMFLLFVGPMFWVELIALRERAEGSQVFLGRCLLFCTAIVLAYTYFFANNNETPRLWIPFIPLLILPLAMRRKAFLANDRAHHKLFVILIALQLIVTTLHWSMMDVRESEYRLTTGRMWD